MIHQKLNQNQNQKIKHKSSNASLLQRQCACVNKLNIENKCPECNRNMTQKLQRQTTTHTKQSKVPSIVHEVLDSPGRYLDKATRTYMEPRFGQDFSNIKIHTDAKASESSHSVNALAYTVSNHIVFRSGQYNPHSSGGRKLLAHELTHTIQQSNNHVSRKALSIGDENSQLEKNADVVADQVISSNPNLIKVRRVNTHLQRTCGPAAIGSVSGCIGLNGQDISDIGLSSHHIYRFERNCDEFRDGEESRLYDYATGISSDAAIEVHGFASEEGDATFNQNLSCARARAATSVLSAATAAEITLFEHGSIRGSREDRRSVVLTTSAPMPPPISKSISIVSWIDRSRLSNPSLFSIASTPPSLRPLVALEKALYCTANREPPRNISNFNSFLASKEFRAFQHYGLSLFAGEHFTPSHLLERPQQIVGYTAPSTCDRIPPNRYLQGESSPINFTGFDFSNQFPNYHALMKFRVGAAEEEAAISEATSFPGSLVFSRSMLTRAPWVWAKSSAQLQPNSGGARLHWQLQASTFPTHTVYVDGIKVDQTSQGVHGFLLNRDFRRADQSRFSLQEDEEQRNIPIERHEQTVVAGANLNGID